MPSIIVNKIDGLIDAFARKLEAAGYFIELSDNRARIEKVEQKLPATLPPAYRSLVTRYSFLDVDVEPLWLFANTGEDATDEWAAIFDDIDYRRSATSWPSFQATLLANGFIQFARLATGSYDPICFDTRQKSAMGEYPIVQMDHEEILQYGRTGKVKELYPSFAAFLENYVR